ncbi:class I SAM-dependent methyltransferase [Tenggerimyces flavus]|uniref:Methyltransferase domain-containing protein n=1 Tax=Tenggerimyces flavus TaxID=1708749 RepID=A0ABV7YKH8_9ACTN|nr:class I SAM-dependent methyltransferase [Tenggerimyces flavus]MBM7789688.1 SAM-dependent methyltransferase [Tenggerimyces flavus]
MNAGAAMARALCAIDVRRGVLERYRHVSQVADLLENWDRSVDYWEVFSALNANDPAIDVYRVLSARFGGPSVEYGVGLGRVAAKVRPTFGVDISPRMIEKAQVSADLAATRLLVADMADVVLPELVSYSYVAFSHFNAFDHSELFGSFANIRKNSLDGGGFVFDMRTPARYRGLQSRLGERFLGHSGDGWEFWVTFGQRERDLFSITCEYQVLGGQSTTIGPFLERAYSDEQVAELLLDAGWELVEPDSYASVDPYRGSVTDRLWVVQARSGPLRSGRR